jgi:hypothetical protein
VFSLSSLLEILQKVIKTADEPSLKICFYLNDFIIVLRRSEVDVVPDELLPTIPPIMHLFEVDVWVKK